MSLKQKKKNKAAKNENIAVEEDIEDRTSKEDQAAALDINESETESTSDQVADVDDRDINEAEETQSGPSKTAANKRKKSPTSQSTPVKSARHSNSKDISAQSTQLQLLQYLLSPSALSLTRPHDESSALISAPKTHLRTYSATTGTLTPFEELLSAVILSRPVSHVLGHRSIRTILNPPYDFTTPGAILEAGLSKCREAMFTARTQHKEKTAAEILHLAEVVVEKFSTTGDGEDTSLEEVRRLGDYDVTKERQLLKGSVKGLGDTGLDIFFRRVQLSWTEWFPLMDERTRHAAAELGLKDDPGDLFGLLDQCWGELDVEGVGGKDEKEKKRMAFVILLERMVGAKLEKKSECVLSEAAQLS
jgi:hypothetical protein